MMVFVGSDGSTISIRESSSLGLEASAADTSNKTTVTMISFGYRMVIYFLVQSYELAHPFVLSSNHQPRPRQDLTIYLFLLIIYQLPPNDPAQVTPINFLRISYPLNTSNTIDCY